MIPQYLNFVNVSVIIDVKAKLKNLLFLLTSIRKDVNI